MWFEKSAGDLPGASGPHVLFTDTNRWPSSARIAVGLAKFGCKVSAVCPRRGHPMASTSVVKQVFPYSSLRPLRSLRRAIERTQPDLIVPCDDRAVGHLHELHAWASRRQAGGSKLTRLIEFSLGPVESFPTVSQRWDFLRLAQDLGLRVPEFRQLRTIEDLLAWKMDHPLPWVLKGDGTFGGRGVRIVDSLSNAQKAFSEITELFGAARAFKRAIVNRDPFWLRPWWYDQKPAVIVQSYVHGRPANCAFLSWNGEVLAMIGVEVLSSDGMTGPATLVRVVDNPEMRIAAERLASRLKLSGFCGLDFMIEQTTGATSLIEMNPRCTPLSHLQLGKGRDLITAIGSRLLGRELIAPLPVTAKEIIAYFPQSADSKNEHKGLSFEDIPEGEPGLVETLLRPWPYSSFLYRLASKLKGVSGVLGKQGTSDRGIGPA